MKETLLDFEPLRQKLHRVVVVEVVYIHGFAPKTVNQRESRFTTLISLGLVLLLLTLGCEWHLNV